ncbi:Hypothetical protein NTJ_15196 [Nesidiocoris tenuis]|uniref:Uncharacterized protein n=1 Tax=Nesidiocoris tenuis TaxID=355587 RepID=A0ABN7BGT8_9HEMI|nr:Hypothetical protein NTJ_15196 [Nesidiocoris tenuis]
MRGGGCEGRPTTQGRPAGRRGDAAPSAARRGLTVGRLRRGSAGRAKRWKRQREGRHGGGGGARASRGGGDEEADCCVDSVRRTNRLGGRSYRP